MRITKSFILQIKWRDKHLFYALSPDKYAGDVKEIKQQILKICNVKRWKDIEPSTLSKTKINNIIWLTRNCSFYKPADIEEILQITKYQRTYITKKEWLTTNNYSTVRMYGKSVSVPIYSLIDILKLQENKSYQQYITKTKSKTKLKEQDEKNLKQLETDRQIRDKMNEALAKQSYNSYQTFHEERIKKRIVENKEYIAKIKQKLDTADSTDEKVQALCYLAQLASRIAKNSYNSKKFYDYKNKICKELYKKGWLIVKFNHSNQPNKTVWGHYYGEVDAIINDYYELYYLEAPFKNSDGYNFSYHFPYLDNKNWLPSKNKLEWIAQEENRNSLYRFGKPANSQEIYISDALDWNKTISKLLENLSENPPFTS